MELHGNQNKPCNYCANILCPYCSTKNWITCCSDSPLESLFPIKSVNSAAWSQSQSDRTSVQAPHGQFNLLDIFWISLADTVVGLKHPTINGTIITSTIIVRARLLSILRPTVFIILDSALFIQTQETYYTYLQWQIDDLCGWESLEIVWRYTGSVRFEDRLKLYKTLYLLHRV